MRAVVLRGGELTVRDTPDPIPGHGDLLLKTLSTAICASDVHFMDHAELAIDDPTGRSLYDADRDIVMGHELVGEVIGHGPGCSDAFPIGARVTSMPIRLVDGGQADSGSSDSTRKRRAVSASCSWSRRLRRKSLKDPYPAMRSPWWTPSPLVSSCSCLATGTR